MVVAVDFKSLAVTVVILQKSQRMPKNKSKLQGVQAVPETGEDFGKMLAEIQALDNQQSPLSTSTPATATADIIATGNSSSSSSGSTSTTRTVVPMPRATVSEEAIIEACSRHDITHLRRWGQQGGRVKIAMPLGV